MLQLNMEIFFYVAAMITAIYAGKNKIKQRSMVK
jgi:hypothetical protein